MTRTQTNAWIFLSLGVNSNTTPVSLDKIIGAADGINKAIPTHTELSIAFGWLLKSKLTEKIGKNYQVTPLGAQLLMEAQTRSENHFDTWKHLEAKFSLITTEADSDEITKVEVNEAYQTYKQEFWKVYEKLDKSDFK